MTILMVPAEDEAVWPTLGPLVCQFIEQNLVYGPGDLLGNPVHLDDEKRAFIWKWYELYPPGHPQAGRRRFERVCLSLSKGQAKALALDTLLPTPTGWITMGSVSVGDELLGSNGRPCQVSALSPVMIGRPCYRVTFNDRATITADADHCWATFTRKPKGMGIYTTSQIRDSLYWHPTRPYSNHRIPLAKPLELPAVNLPIPPYTLGIWLGDGSNANSMVTKGPDDLAEIEPHINAEDIKTRWYRYKDRAPNLWLAGLNPTLRSLGLFGNKHIPVPYLRGSYRQRLALLQGLMDSDGTAGNGICAFSSKDKALALGVLELARTLGLRPTWQVKPARLYGVDYGDYYKVSFTPRDDVPVFRLDRKARAARRTAHKASQTLARTIVSVEPVQSVPVRCIAVDTDDHLYLAGEGMVPTHNTELAAWIAACELHHDAPVRFAGWDKRGRPLGQPLRDPYIAMVAYDEEQTELLAYGALKAILEESPIAQDFDIGLERITRRRGDGRAEALSSSPNARDGARTTFQHFDETHLMTHARLKLTHLAMLGNISKRQMADGWSLETTTAPEPGAGSVAEETMAYARAVSEGRAATRNFFFFHRQASEKYDLDTEEGARAALLESYGPNAGWANMEAKINLWFDPQCSREYFQRYFCNQLVRRTAKAFDAVQWAKLIKPDYVIPDGALITLGFDGAMFEDATGLVACEVATGHLQIVGVWERPYGPVGEGWQVPEQEVDDAVAAAYQRWKVWRMYADPPYWQSWVSTWAGRYGTDHVVEWWTNRRIAMTRALEAFSTAIQTGALSHDGNDVLARHVGNAHKHELKQRDEQLRPLWLIRKERSDSPNKIDLAMAAVLSLEARNDAIATGVTAAPKEITGEAFWV